MLSRLLFLLALPDLAFAALLPGAFQPGQTNVTGLGTNGTQFFAGGDSWPVPAALQPTAPFTFQRSPSGEVVYAVRSGTGACQGAEVSLWRLGPPGDLPTQLGGDFCVEGGVAWYRYFDLPQQSDLQVVAVAETSSTLGRQRILWVDLDSGASSWRSYNEQLEAVSLRFAPSGTVALVKHDLPVDADHTLVDLCPGSLGEPLATYVDAGATVSAQVVDLGGSYVARTSVAGAPDVPLVDCLGTVPPPPPGDQRLVVAVEGSGAANGFVSGPGISCGADCLETYTNGDVVTLTASAGGDTVFDRWLGDCSGTAPTTTVTMSADRTCRARFTARSANLSVTLASTPPVVAGLPSPLVLQVDNFGPDVAPSARVELQLPPGLATTALDPRCQALFGDRISCQLGDLAPTATEQPAITLDLPGSARGPLSLTATVSSFRTDPVPANDTATLVLAPEARVDVSVVKTATVDPVDGDFFYVIEVDNAGPSTEIGAVVTDVLPAGVTVPGHGATATCALDTVAAGGTTRVVLPASADPSLVGSLITNTASIAVTGQDADTSDDIDSVTTAVGAPRAAYDRAFTFRFDDRTPVAGVSPDMSTPVALSDGRWFYADRQLAMMGIEDQAVPLITPGTTIPGQDLVFTHMFWDRRGPSVDGGRFAISPYPTGALNGIWTTGDCGLELVFDRRTDNPNPFIEPGDHNPNGARIGNGRFAYWSSGRSPGSIQIHEPGAGFATVVDSATVRPNDQQPFDGVSTEVSFDGTWVAFWGSNGATFQLPGGGFTYTEAGIFYGNEAGLFTAADVTTAVPGTSDTFSNFQAFTALADGWVYFEGAGTIDPFASGLYRYEIATGTLQTVVDASVVFPGSTVPMGFRASYTAEGDRVVFSAWDPQTFTRNGLYLWDAGTVRPLLIDGDTIDGRAVFVGEVAVQAMDDGLLAVTVTHLDDFSTAAYVVDLAALPDRLTLDATPMVVGSPATFTVTGADPGDTVNFGVSSRYGATCPPALGGQCLGLDRPILLGSSTADATGTATLTVTVPPTAPVRVYTQAAVVAGTASRTSPVLSSLVTP